MFSFFLSKRLMTQKKASLHFEDLELNQTNTKKKKKSRIALFVLFVSKIKFKIYKSIYAVQMPFQLNINQCYFIQFSYIMIFAVVTDHWEKKEKWE